MTAALQARSLLFVPGDRPDRFAKAVAAGADAVILDLEDAVAPDAKAEALGHALSWLERGHTAVVRVNGTGTPWLEHTRRVSTMSSTVRGSTTPIGTCR